MNEKSSSNHRNEDVGRNEITSIQIDGKVEKEQEPKEKETLLTINHATNRTDVDDFDESISRPVYDSPTIRVKKSRTLNWYEDLSKMQRDTNGLFDFLRNTKDYLDNQTPAWMCLIGVLFLFFYSFAMMIVGSINANNCSIEKNIAIYMIVAGLFTMIKLSLNIFVQVKRLLTKTIPEIAKSLYVKIFDGVMCLFLVIWFFAGCVWVYGVYDNLDFHNYHDVGRRNFYCNPHLYHFAFWTLTLTIIFVTFLLSAAIGFVLYLKFKNIKNMESKS